MSPCWPRCTPPLPASYQLPCEPRHTDTSVLAFPVKSATGVGTSSHHAERRPLLCVGQEYADETSWPDTVTVALLPTSCASTTRPSHSPLPPRWLTRIDRKVPMLE